MMDVCNKKLSSTCTEKLSRIKIDNKLTFEEHVEGRAKAKKPGKTSVLWQEFHL